jgi:hypothetical protein
MVKSGLSIVVVAVLLGHVNAAWLWGSGPQAKGEVEITGVEQPLVSGENPTPTLSSEVAQTQNSALPQSDVMMSQDNKATKMVEPKDEDRPEATEPSTVSEVPVVTETEPKAIIQDPLVTVPDNATASVITENENATSSPEASKTENAQSLLKVTETENATSSSKITETEQSNLPSVATETEQPIVQPASNWRIVNWFYGAQQPTSTNEPKESVTVEPQVNNASVSEPNNAGTKEEPKNETVTVADSKPQPISAVEEPAKDIKEEPKTDEQPKEEANDQPKKALESLKATKKSNRKPMGAKKPKKERKSVEKPKEQPEAVEELKAEKEEPVYSGWRIFRFLSSPFIATTTTPEVQIVCPRLADLILVFRSSNLSRPLLPRSLRGSSAKRRPLRRRPASARS